MTVRHIKGFFSMLRKASTQETLTLDGTRHIQSFMTNISLTLGRWNDPLIDFEKAMPIIATCSRLKRLDMQVVSLKNIDKFLDITNMLGSLGLSEGTVVSVWAIHDKGPDHKGREEAVVG